ncbi:MAG: metalloregulator ArsR/SmtB family transcription factor [Actinomycetota bacterium]|nr:metalloregulator ArsR/SmtB family transcription factor [Actinomycetota bacterium]MDQ3733412.1 metalloregulator ArsR/SmtB family transcription factor [Actinomycetota bacterium]
MGDRVAKDLLFAAFAETAKALASGRRAEIVDLLAQGERSVDQIAEQITQSVANTSHHLQTLARAGLLTSRRDGTRIYYALASERVVDLWTAIRAVTEEQSAGLEKLALAYLGDRSELEAIGHGELVERMRAGSVVVLDVRPAIEYAAGRISGARSMPLPELRRRLDTLPKDAQIVAYCRGPYCVYADDAVRQLRSAGFQAARLTDGYPEWKKAGLPVESGPSPQ